MDKKEIGLAAGLTASLAGGVQAETREWDHYFNQSIAQINTEQYTGKQQFAKQVAKTGEITKKQVAQIQSELSNKFSFDVSGAENYIQGNASFIHNNLGVGLQTTHTSNINQFALTGGIEFTPNEASALSRVINNGQIKVSLVESEMKNAIANFDETGLGVEFVVNLKNAFLKQISVSHSQHYLSITDGSNKWRITNTESSSAIDRQQTALQTIQTTSTTTNTHEARNVTQDVNQRAIQVLLGLTKDMDAVLSYAKDSLGTSLSLAELEYRLNGNWSLNAGYEETRRFSGSNKQDIKTATVNYNKNNWSAFAGLRDNGIDTSPYAGVQYRINFGKPTQSSNNDHAKNKSTNIGNTLISPAQGATELHPHAITQETRVTTTLETSKSIDNSAKGALSNISTTTNSCNADFNVADKDGVTGIIVRLSNGDEQQLSEKSGNVTFTGLSNGTSYTMDLFGITKNGLNNTVETNRLGTATCTTKNEVIPSKEDPTNVSDIAGDMVIKSGQTPTYSITATDGDHGIASVTATINGSNISVAHSGDNYSVTLTESMTTSAGTIDIEFSVTGTKEDDSNDTTIMKTKTVEVQENPVEYPTQVSSISGLSTVSIGDTPTYSITASDDNGISSVTATTNGSPITVSQSGDNYSITLPSSVSSSASTLNIEFIVTGKKANGSDDTSLSRTKNIKIEPAKSNPMLNPIGTVNVDDNGGGLPTTIPAPTGSDIQAGAKYSLIGAPAGLTIDEDTGEMTFNQDVNGNQTDSVTVQVTNPDGQSNTATFAFNVTDNG